jgi:hypothetical protein
MFGLVELEFRLFIYFWWGKVTLFLLLYILSSWLMLHTDTWLCNLPGSGLKVPVVGGWLKVNIVISFGLALA